MSSGTLSDALGHEVKTLRKKINSLEQDVSNLEATISQIVTSQEARISELECSAHPFGQSGEAICNWLDFD